MNKGTKVYVCYHRKDKTNTTYYTTLDMSECANWLKDTIYNSINREHRWKINSWIEGRSDMPNLSNAERMLYNWLVCDDKELVNLAAHGKIPTIMVKVVDIDLDKE